MSEKKNKRPFGEDADKDDIGFRIPSNPGMSEEEKEPGEEGDIETKEEDDSNDAEDEDDFDNEERGWHTFDMDNPDESL